MITMKKLIRVLCYITVVSCFSGFGLTGCVTKSLMKSIDEDQTGIVIWKKDEIRGVSQSTTNKGVKTWTLIGKNNNYQLSDETSQGKLNRNFTAFLNNPKLSPQAIELSSWIQCYSQKNLSNDFMCYDVNIIYRYPDEVTPQQKNSLKKAFNLNENDPATSVTFILSGSIKPNNEANAVVIPFKNKSTIVINKNKSSFSSKYLLMPFSVVADVITAPFQAIGYLIIINSLPAMRY